MKIFFNRVERFEPYGGGSHFVTEMTRFLREKGHEVVFSFFNDNKETINDIDVIFLIDPRPGDIGFSVNHAIQYKSINPNVKILHRVNECDARKDTNFMDKMLIETFNYADKIVFISNWLKKYFIDKGANVEDCKVIYNGCNLNNFRPLEKDNNKIKIVTHHWSDNWMKGFDLYKYIDEKFIPNNPNFEFTYVGRYSKKYNPKHTKVIPPLHGKWLGDEIRKHDIYVTASRFEPCGMHHVEGAASGLPVIYHTDGGGINELCSNHGEEISTVEDFDKVLNKVLENIDYYKNKIDYSNLNIEKCCESFYNEILDMVKK